MLGNMAGKDTRDDAGYIGDVMRLKDTLMRLLDRKKPPNTVRGQVNGSDMPETTGKVVIIGEAPRRQSRLHRFEHTTKRNIRPLRDMSVNEIILAAQAKGRKLTKAEARVVKNTAGDAVADDVEQVMYRHGFFSS